MKYKRLCFIILFVWLLPSKALCQTIENQREIWLGYMSSVKITDRFSLWNDFHYVSTSFFASRHGLTYFFQPQHSISAGYAWVVTSTGFSDKLIRPENRLWAQMAGRLSIRNKTLYQYRLRYDARFRKMISNSEILDDRIFYHRIRLMNGLRFYIKDLPNQRRLHFDVLDELLLNFGKQVNNEIDQNRLYLLLGLSKKNITVLSGYDWRIIPMQNGNFIFRHGLTVWIIHNMSFR
ncbi:DUF2490 domain-containing protein [Cytophagaceae bacterium ABcell3]|nr:DUF2490 domain-containing protein [Cytophagaceae bacterium ABcell3]